MEVIEQILYLLFLRRLDELQTLEEQKAQTLGIPIDTVFLSQRQGRQRAAVTLTSAGPSSRDTVQLL